MTRVLIEATGAVSGGIARMLTESLAAWPDGDELHVIGAAALCDALPAGVISHPIAGGGRAAMLSSAIRNAPRIRRSVRPDRVLSISPSLPGAILQPDVTVLHDLFFRLWPRGESARVRAYRAVSYQRALNASRIIACVSSRTRHDLVGWLPHLEPRCYVWREAPAGIFLKPPSFLAGEGDPEPGSYVVVPAHNDYKGSELVVEGLSRPDDPLVCLLAGSQERAATLARRFATAHRQPQIWARLRDDALARRIAGAAALIMASHIEGFGLPVIEAQALGTPVIVSPDPALWEASSGLAIRMQRWDRESLREAWMQSTATPPNQWIDAQDRAQTRTWTEAASDLRHLVTR